MANDFQNSIASGVGAARTDLYTAPSATGKRSMIISLELANVHSSAITVDVEIYDNSATSYVVIKQSKHI